jgi:hypothetical protein
LALARDRRVAREEATARLDHARTLSDEHVGPRFAKTRRGWQVVIPNDHEGGPWETGSELEVVTRTGRVVWVTLVRLSFCGGDARRSEWWLFVEGRQSTVTLHEVGERPAHTPPPEDKSESFLLDDDDMDRVSTGAGAAYLMARRKKADA